MPDYPNQRRQQVIYSGRPTRDSRREAIDVEAHAEEPAEIEVEPESTAEAVSADEPTAETEALSELEDIDVSEFE